MIQCKKRDIHAFTRLVELTQSYAYRLAFRLLRSEDDADDVTQEAFIRVWQNLGTFNYHKSFTTWLYKIVTHLCLDHLKSRSRRNKLFKSPSQCEEEASPGSHCPEADYDNRDLASHIESLVHHLPLKQQAVFILRDLQDLDIKEVSSILGMSAGAVKSNLYYARQAIRTNLEQLEKD
jgi:RNA polymerase sigma-70 factor (ECF subfamily)